MNILATAVRSLLRYKPTIAWRPNTKLLREFVALAIYLYVCFVALLLFKAVVLRGQAIVYAPYALALGKALLLAKFIIVGRKLGIGWPFASSTLVHKIIYNSMVFLVFLAVLSAIEHAIDAKVHHRTFSESLADLGGTPGEIIVTSLLLLLVLIPYFAYGEINTVLPGRGKLFQVLWCRPDGLRDQSSVKFESSPPAGDPIGATQTADSRATTDGPPASQPAKRTTM